MTKTIPVPTTHDIMTQTDIDFRELNTILPFMKDGMSLDDIKHLCLIYDVSFEKFEDVFEGKFRAVSGMPASQKKKIESEIDRLEDEIGDKQNEIDGLESEVYDLKKKLKVVDGEEISEMSQTDIYLILNTR